MSLERIAWIMLVALAAAVPNYALAIGEHMSFAQVPDGSINAILSGAQSGCPPPGFSPPQVAIAGSNITITTIVVPILTPCPVPPPGTPPPPPTTDYSLSANLGHLANGIYSVNWMFFGTTVASGALVVSGGALIDPLAIPTLSTIGLVLLAVFMIVAARWQRRNAV